MTDKVNKGDHFWALLGGELVVIFMDYNGDCTVAGAWECTIPLEQLEGISVIPKPEEYSDTTFYFSHVGSGTIEEG